MNPSRGKVSLPQFAQSKGAGKCTKGGTHFGGDGDWGHCIMESTECSQKVGFRSPSVPAGCPQMLFIFPGPWHPHL